LRKTTKGLTSRQRKIFQKKLESLTESDIASIWKIWFKKKMTPEELEQFEMLRREYKQRTGKILPQAENKTTRSKQ